MEKFLTEQERNDNIKVHPKFWVDLFWLESIFMKFFSLWSKNDYFSGS